MPQALLKPILNQLQSLEPSELQQLSQVIQRYLRGDEVPAKRAAFHQALVGSGNELCIADGLSPIIFVSADGELNLAAVNEGLLIENPNHYS